MYDESEIKHEEQITFDNEICKLYVDLDVLKLNKFKKT